jgi:hypothetical protein
MFSLAFYQFMKISTEDQNTTNKMFVDYARQFKDDLKKQLNIQDDHI